MKWKQYKVKDSKYDLRFKYFKAEFNGTVYYERLTRVWWKPFEWLGRILARLDYKLNEKGMTSRFGRFHWWIRKYLTFN